MQKMQDRKNIGKIILDPTIEPKPKPVSTLSYTCSNITADVRHQYAGYDVYGNVICFRCRLPGPTLQVSVVKIKKLLRTSNELPGTPLRNMKETVGLGRHSITN